MRQIKDNDLVLLSDEMINTRDDEHDIKKVTNAEFLRNLLIR